MVAGVRAAADDDAAAEVVVAVEDDEVVDGFAAAEDDPTADRFAAAEDGTAAALCFGGISEKQQQQRNPESSGVHIAQSRRASCSAIVGPPRAIREPSWATCGPSLCCFWRFLGHLEAIGGFWCHFGPRWGFLGTSWDLKSF